jgi:Protein of unknown function (DUF2510)
MNIRRKTAYPSQVSGGQMIGGQVRFVENLTPRPKQLWWLAAIIVISVLGGAAYAVPFVVVAFCYSLLRFHATYVQIDSHNLAIGKRIVPLLSLDPASLGNPRNTWPWMWFSKRRITAVPVWTKGSIGIQGRNTAGKLVIISIGTNHKEELIAALTGAIAEARRAVMAQPTNHASAIAAQPAGWFPDPWDPIRSIRYFDGNGWTGWILPAPGRTDRLGRVA